jgi:hypothetical protein
MPEFNKSKDGVMRCTRWASIRFDAVEEREVVELARRKNMTVREFLDMCLRGGLEHELQAEP